MGRSKKNKNKHRASHTPADAKRPANAKRPKRERFWIEDCADTVIPAGKTCRMEVLITRAELEDNYTNVPNANDKGNQETEDKTETKGIEKVHGDKKESEPAVEVKNELATKDENESDRETSPQDEAKDKDGNTTQNKTEKASSETTSPNKKIRLESPFNESKVSGDTKIEEETEKSDEHALKATDDDSIDNALVCVKRSAGSKQPIKKVRPLASEHAFRFYLVPSIFCNCHDSFSQRIISNPCQTAIVAMVF
jgi:hypothetical protein